jgi:hypothetical protein
MSPTPDEHPGILPAVNEIREILGDCNSPDVPSWGDRRRIARLLDHIEDVTRDRVKARGMDRGPMYVAVSADAANAIFDEAAAGVRYDRM